jgi:hypothetical protein
VTGCGMAGFREFLDGPIGPPKANTIQGKPIQPWKYALSKKSNEMERLFRRPISLRRTFPASRDSKPCPSASLTSPSSTEALRLV